MKRTPLLLLFVFLFSYSHAQDTEKVWRINIINPGIEYEHPVTTETTLSVNLGIGYSGAYPNLSETTGTGGLYAFAPFADIQYKWFYNLGKRDFQSKTVEHNSANFLSLRFRTRGKSIEDNFERYANYDFAIGPTWGIQRKYGNFHLLLDLGPQFYFDSKGNSGFWPLMPQINIGVDV